MHEAPQLESFSPATGERLGAVAIAGTRDVGAAIEQAASVQPLWATLRARDRARYMARAAQAVIDEFDELAELLGAEQGRPRAEAEVMELLAAVETLQWLAEHGPHILGGERIPFSRTQHPVKRGRWSYEPLGVVGVLGPATEPFATPLGDVAVALMAGNGAVLKPSPHVPLCAERIARVFARAGLPEGLLRVVHGHTDAGAALVDGHVAQVRFTGSTRAGREVGEACARGLKRSVLALDGKDAMLVLADADVPRAARGAAWAAFANAGQCGGSVEHALCLPGVFERFLAAVVAGAQALRVGDPRDPATSIGPLVARERVQRVTELVEEVVAAGATLHSGGPAGAAHFAPAVLTGVGADTRLAREEVPGPVLVVESVESEEAAIARANEVGLGLGASVWTADRYKGARIARELRAGMVWMNDHLVARSAPQIPWGGVGGAGIGRTRGAIALRTCAEPKVVTWDPPIGRPAWWFPYDEHLARAARAVAGLRSARDADRERALREDAVPLLRVTGRWLRAMRRST
ncbi:MAG TPA: aldehyde dehydrogenase family protein [Solirubrobacteraceae bacterium]|jgi:acyl-CoA reductase-like NAD-dependent aldehyde dehydrogenase